MKKKILLTIFLILIIISITNIVFADEITSAMSGINASNGNSVVVSTGRQILGVVTAIGISVALVMIIVIAIRFLLASADGKAELKQQLIPYLIGAIIIFAASSLLQIPYYLGQEINKVAMVPHQIVEITKC